MKDILKINYLITFWKYLKLNQEGRKKKNVAKVTYFKSDPNTPWSPETLTNPESWHPGYPKSIKKKYLVQKVKIPHKHLSADADSITDTIIQNAKNSKYV